MNERRPLIVASEDPAARALAQIATLAEEAYEERGCFHVALSGGSTPRRLYEQLARSSLNLSYWQFWFGDERHVPHDHEDSNFKMASECLLEPAKIPARRVHPVPTHLPLGEAAEDYATEIAAYVPGEVDRPRFDLCLLGMGEDGHTASLFPTDPQWRSYEGIVVPVEPAGVAHRRLTLTLDVLNAARAVFFLVEGEHKARRLREVLDGSKDLPAAAVRPWQGGHSFFIDHAAGRYLEAGD